MGVGVNGCGWVGGWVGVGACVGVGVGVDVGVGVMWHVRVCGCGCPSRWRCHAALLACLAPMATGTQLNAAAGRWCTP